MNALYDTFLNVVAFAFIGLLVWLYFKDFTAGGPAASEAGADTTRRERDDD